MRDYSNKITLTKNSRGIYSLDTSMGCTSGTKNNKNGCYDDCYAARYGNKYGYNFSNTQLRFFEDEKHIKSIIRKINNIDSDFIRVGTSGDPSENWAHTIGVLEELEGIEKEIVIITKHFTKLKKDELRRLKNLNVCVNTSVSALDFLENKESIKNKIIEYTKLRNYSKSVLRVVSCDFNIVSSDGKFLNNIQDDLLNNYEVLETAFRCSPKNKYVTSGLINIEKGLFLGKKCNFSLRKDSNIYLGNCKGCIEKCGLR